MAKYMLLIFGEDRVWDAMSPEELSKISEGHRDFTAAAGSAVLAAGELEAASTATSLRADETGRATPTDGPFLETKEALGGFYVVEAGDLDEVVALASRLHEVYAGHSGVEIRPLANHG